MSTVNLGRVQGGGIFYSTASSGTSIAKSTLTPTGLVPLIGDCVVFPNGDLRKITATSGDNITCGSVAANFKGDKGDTCTTSSIVKTAAEWESQNPVLGAGVFGYDSTYGIVKVGDGSTSWDDLNIISTKSKPTFADSDWATIAELSENGQAQSFFSVGDEKTIELSTGEQVTLVILGFNHDNLTAGGKAGITLGMKDLLATRYQMNSSKTNARGWTNSAMRTSTMQTLLGQLPYEVKAVIKPVNKLTSAGGQSTTINTTSDSMFLLSEIEVFGTSSFSVAGEGTQYAYYRDIANTNEKRVKKLSNGTGSADGWWLRSPYASTSEGFCVVYMHGGAGNYFASISNSVSFGFCI